MNKVKIAKSLNGKNGRKKNVKIRKIELKMKILQIPMLSKLNTVEVA